MKGAAETAATAATTATAATAETAATVATAETTERVLAVLAVPAVSAVSVLSRSRNLSLAKEKTNHENQQESRRPHQDECGEIQEGARALTII